MIPIYAGFDPREEIGFHTFCSSVIHHASEPVTISPLHLDHFKQFYNAGQRDGTNAFIFSRFLVPYLHGFSGHAIFADGADMIVKADIAELWALRNPFLAVQVVHHDYKTRHPRKYVGTSMEAANEDYPRKNMSSLMLINCAHYAWRHLTPDVVSKMSGAELHRFQFIEERFIGELPAVWNWLPQEHGENPEAKLVHYSIGSPGFPMYNATEMASDFFDAMKKVTYITP